MLIAVYRRDPDGVEVLVAVRATADAAEVAIVDDVRRICQSNPSKSTFEETCYFTGVLHP